MFSVALGFGWFVLSPRSMLVAVRIESSVPGPCVEGRGCAFANPDGAASGESTAVLCSRSARCLAPRFRYVARKHGPTPIATASSR